VQSSPSGPAAPHAHVGSTIGVRGQSDERELKWGQLSLDAPARTLPCARQGNPGVFLLAELEKGSDREAARTW
jgi:hypothetical protein